MSLIFIVSIVISIFNKWPSGYISQDGVVGNNNIGANLNYYINLNSK